MYELQVIIDADTLVSDLGTLAKLAGKPIDRQEPMFWEHAVYFRFDTEEEARDAERRILDLDIVRATYVQD